MSTIIINRLNFELFELFHSVLPSLLLRITKDTKFDYLEKIYDTPIIKLFKIIKVKLCNRRLRNTIDKLDTLYKLTYPLFQKWCYTNTQIKQQNLAEDEENLKIVRILLKRYIATLAQSNEDINWIKDNFYSVHKLVYNKPLNNKKHIVLQDMGQDYILKYIAKPNMKHLNCQPSNVKDKKLEKVTIILKIKRSFF